MKRAKDGRDMYGGTMEIPAVYVTFGTAVAEQLLGTGRGVKPTIGLHLGRNTTNTFDERRQKYPRELSLSSPRQWWL